MQEQWELGQVFRIMTHASPEIVPPHFHIYERRPRA